LHIAGAVIGISASAPAAGDIAVNSNGTIGIIVDPNNGIASAPAIAARIAIFTALGDLNYASGLKNDPMTNYASEAGSSFAAVPLLVA
jgi:hypothetical protein